jgi:hypothetical protein
MKRAIIAAFIISLALNIEAQAQTQTFSTLIGVVTDVKSRWLGVRSDAGDAVQVRVGMSTVYPNRIPVVGDKVKVEYLISRGVSVGYAVTVLERAKKPVESQPQLLPGLPPEISVFVGKWEGSWDNRKDMNFSLTIPNINLEVAEVNYQSNDLNFSEKAKVISGEEPKIEWMIHPTVRLAIPGGAMPIWFTFEIQRDGTLKGILDDRSVSRPVTRKAVLRRAD